MNYVTGRKIIGAAVMLIAALAVTYFKGDIPPHLEMFMEVIYGTFVLGNGFEYFSKMKTESKSNK